MRTLLIALFLTMTPAWTMSAQETRPIERGRSVSGTLEGAEDQYTLELRPDMFVYGEVDQIDVDVVVTVRGPDAAVVRSFDGPARGPEIFQFESESAGTFTIAVAGFEGGEGQYRIALLSVERVAAKPEARVDQMMRPYTGKDRPGGVVGVVIDGKLDFTRAYGMASLEHGVPFEAGTISNIGSVTKQFTAMGLLLLEAKGKLSLDDDIRKHIPELPDFGAPITLKNLLNHTGGYREIYNLLPLTGYQGEDGFPREMAIRIVQRQQDLQASPNTEWNYNNTGYILLSMVVERVSGQAFDEYLVEAVFEPLGMTDTRVKMAQGEVIPRSAQGYVSTKEGGWRSARDLASSAGAGGIYTTVQDLQRWMMNYRDAGLGGEEAITAMSTTAVLADGDSTGYGLGLGVGKSGGRTIYSHTGGDVAHRAYLGYYPELENGVILLSNNANFDLGMGSRIARVFFGDELEPEEEAVAEPADPQGTMSPEHMEAIAGDWVLDVQGMSMDIDISVEEGALYAEVAGQSRVRVSLTSDSTFAIPSANAVATFHFESDGTVDRATLSQGADMPMRRIEKVELDEDALADFAGRYYSDEIETYYEIRAADGKLSLHSLRMEPVALSHRSGDEFSGSVIFLANVTFQRAGNGRIMGLTVSNGRTKGILFRRL